MSHALWRGYEDLSSPLEELGCHRMRLIKMMGISKSLVIGGWISTSCKMRYMSMYWTPTALNANQFWRQDNISHNLSLRPAIVRPLVLFSRKASLTKRSILG